MQEKSFINSQLGIKFNSYIDHKCRVWFKAKEVATILGYRDTDKAMRKHVDKEDKHKGPAKTVGGLQTCVFISESGLYSLVISSKLETAKKFKRWITSEVLPSIRKYSYFKLFDSKIKQRVIFDEVKYYKHPVFSNYAANKNGDILSLKTQKNLSMLKGTKGYLFFKICDKKLEKPKNYLQHRFVYEVFKGVIPSCFEVDHINEIKFDNRIKNLQLLTPQKNCEKTNSKPIISTHLENGKEKRYISIKKASDELDIDFSCISKICRKIRKTATSKKMGISTHSSFYIKFLILVLISKC